MMLTRLLPSRIEPISRSLSSVSVSTRSAPRDPCPASWCMVARFAAVRAVSEAEKKADNASRATIRARLQRIMASEISLASAIAAIFYAWMLQRTARSGSCVITDRKNTAASHDLADPALASCQLRCYLRVSPGPPSSSGLGRRPLTAETGVRVPLGVPLFLCVDKLDYGMCRTLEGNRPIFKTVTQAIYFPATGTLSRKIGRAHV